MAKTAVAAAESDDQGDARGKNSNGSKARGGKRNVNGEGNIRQRSDGRWEGRAYILTTDGREVRRSVYGKTWDEAHEKVTKLQAESMSGVRMPGSAWTMAEFLDYWPKNVVADRVRPSTYASYEYLTRRYILPYIGKRKLARFQAPDIRQFLGTLKKVCQCCALGKDERRPAAKRRCCAKTPRKCCGAFLADGSIRYVHRILRAAMQDAVVDGLLNQNAARNLRLNHRYRPHFTPYSADEAKRLLAAARFDRWYALYAVALALGLRRGEALALRWTDVDFVDGVLNVHQSLQRVNGALRFGT
jgi:hypothetical protein